MKINKTNAARLLDQTKIAYELIPYEFNENDLSAPHVAEALNEPIEQVFKTLVLKGDKSGYFVCVIPGVYEVDLKLAAKASGNKNCEILFNIYVKFLKLNCLSLLSENGIKTQIRATMIAHLLLTVLKRKSKSNKAFSTVATLIRIHFISHLDLYWVIEKGRRTYAKCTKSRNKSPETVQLSLFG